MVVGLVQADGLKHYDTQTFVVINSDPFHSYVRGIEVASGKKDQIAIDDSGLDV